MGIDTPTGNTRKLEELDRQIEGRWALINRLFEDVEELVEERNLLTGRNTGILDRLFGRREHAPAPVGKTIVRRPEIRRPSSSKSSADRRRNIGGIRAVS